MDGSMIKRFDVELKWTNTKCLLYELPLLEARFGVHVSL